MAIKRISDLSGILLDGKDTNNQSIKKSIEQGVIRDVLGGTVGGVNNETKQLKESLFEVSWVVKENYETDVTKYNSKSINYETLCAYITHNIQLEDYYFKGNKSLSGDFNLTGNLNLIGNVNLSGDTFKAKYKNINLTGETINLSGKTINIQGAETVSVDAISTYVHGKYIYIHGDNEINLSIINQEEGKPLRLIYGKELKIQLQANKDTLKDVMVFGRNGDNNPTIKADQNGVGVEKNPLQTTAQYARWG